MCIYFCYIYIYYKYTIYKYIETIPNVKKTTVMTGLLPLGSSSSLPVPSAEFSAGPMPSIPLPLRAAHENPWQS